jgi:hypothetical protein
MCVMYVCTYVRMYADYVCIYARVCVCIHIHLYM